MLYTCEATVWFHVHYIIAVMWILGLHLQWVWSGLDSSCLSIRLMLQPFSSITAATLLIVTIAMQITPLKLHSDILNKKNTCCLLSILHTKTEHCNCIFYQYRVMTETGSLRLCFVSWQNVFVQLCAVLKKTSFTYLVHVWVDSQKIVSVLVSLLCFASVGSIADFVFMWVLLVCVKV